ncbi:MAG: AmmeMemoRadiSam system radical SAM enzyme [Nitrososphaerales archaeon]
MVKPTSLTLPQLDELTRYPSVRQTPLASTLPNGRVRCGVCQRRCAIPPGRFGFCATRVNIRGNLHTVTYGDVSSISANPIEKKPFFHFWPGSYALTIGTWGCNLTCLWCQNFEISKYPPDPLKAGFFDAKRLLDTAVAEGCQGVSFSFNEPTMLFEYALDVFPLARKRGLYSNYVSNGYMTGDVLEMLKDAGMEAIKFDVKGDREAVRRFCAADVDYVWRNVGLAKELELHVEVVTLIIPGVNDSEEQIERITKRHLREAGEDTPLHFTRFYPAYRMVDRPPTPVETLERASRIARKLGVHYVYLGNLPGHRPENTYCHNCNELLVKRYGLTVVRYSVAEGRRCPKCGCKIPIVGEYVP